MGRRLRRSGGIAGPLSARWPRLPWHLRKVRLRRKDGKYATTQQFLDKVLHPFGARFSSGDPFRPVNIRAIYDDEDNSTVVVVWDGRGTTTAGTTYDNTYAWFMTLSGGKVIDGTAFYDSIAFNELWDGVTP
jgi:hypothetical protein